MKQKQQLVTPVVYGQRYPSPRPATDVVNQSVIGCGDIEFNVVSPVAEPCHEAWRGKVTAGNNTRKQFGPMKNRNTITGTMNRKQTITPISFLRTGFDYRRNGWYPRLASSGTGCTGIGDRRVVLSGGPFAVGFRSYRKVRRAVKWFTRLTLVGRCKQSPPDEGCPRRRGYMELT